jgi:hypothetical protein
MQTLYAYQTRRTRMRTCSELMTLFVGLVDNEFHTAPVKMWSEVFSSWASLHRRPDDESREQLAEYAAFLRASVAHVKQLRDRAAAEMASDAKANPAEIVLQNIFGHVARLVGFAERKIAAGKLPRNEESAVLHPEVLMQLLEDVGGVLLKEAVERDRRERSEA